MHKFRTDEKSFICATNIQIHVNCKQIVHSTHASRIAAMCVNFTIKEMKMKEKNNWMAHVRI